MSRCTLQTQGLPRAPRSQDPSLRPPRCPAHACILPVSRRVTPSSSGTAAFSGLTLVGQPGGNFTLRVSVPALSPSMPACSMLVRKEACSAGQAVLKVRQYVGGPKPQTLCHAVRGCVPGHVLPGVGGTPVLMAAAICLRLPCRRTPLGRPASTAARHTLALTPRRTRACHAQSGTSMSAVSCPCWCPPMGRSPRTRRARAFTCEWAALWFRV